MIPALVNLANDWPTILLAALAATLIYLIIFRPWPHEVTERGAYEGSSAVRAEPVREAGLSPRSVTSQLDELESLPAPHHAGERGDRPDSLRSSALRGLTAPAGATVFDWDADGIGDAA